MKHQEKLWNEIFKNINKEPVYDLWLDKYENILKKSKKVPIIDLGCGNGNNTLYLVERGYKVISCDFSKEALKLVMKFVPNSVVMKFDMTEGLPFKTNSKRIIIADLSIHYFAWETTQKLLNEIKRVLVKGGVFLGRVNSDKDYNYGAREGVQIERGLFKINGKYKRFFSKPQLQTLFKNWEIINLQHTQINRYGKPKKVLEIAAKKI